MKLNRVNLEEDKVNNKQSNVTIIGIKKLKENYRNLKELEKTHNVSDIRNEIEVNNISRVFQRNDENFNSGNIPIMKSPVNIIKPGMFNSWINTETNTKDKTVNIKKIDRSPSSAKILSTNNSSHLHNNISLIQLKLLTNKPTEEQTDYFNAPSQEQNKVFSNFFPVQIEFPSQISFDNNIFTKSEDHCESQSKSFNNSCNLAESCECSECEREYEEYDDEIYSQENILLSELQTPQQLKLNLRSPNDYKDFGLFMNSQIIQSSSEQTHQLLPHRFKNDESYKMKLFKYLRKPQFKDNKTLTYKFNINEKRKFTEAFDLSDFYGETNFKRRKVSSERKIFETEHAFKDIRIKGNKFENVTHYFKFYSDKEIGFNRDWQRQLIQTEMDDDVATDDDQLKLADRHVLRELGDGIKAFIKNRKNVRNFALTKFN